MPTYCFICEKCGNLDELYDTTMTGRKHMKCVCGARMNRDFGVEAAGPTCVGRSEWISVNAGVTPPQAKGATVRLQEATGTAAYYDASGRLHCSGRDRKTVLKAKGLHDMDKGEFDQAIKPGRIGS